MEPLNKISMASMRKLLHKSLSKSKPNLSKSHLFADENHPPLDPNIQVVEPYDSRKEVAVARSEHLLDVPSDQAVKVAVRIRAANDKANFGDRTVKKISDDLLAVGDRRFGFDSVFDWNSKQEDVFRLVGAPLVKDALAGYNTSILSYGQSGSGKTYTMWGPPSAMVEGHSASNQRGIVPRIFQMLFSEIQREQENLDGKQISYQCRCSFLEIYNGQIRDLLDPTHRNLEIKDDAKNGFYIENLTEEYVTSYDDVTQILIKGLSNRKVGTTSTNSKSSRSHIVFTCIIESWCKETISNGFSSSKTSRITLVDLAGLERNKHEEAGREFVKERKNVKSSLSHLGHLVNILAKGTQPDSTVYSSCSSLTQVLQESLGGNAKLSVLCTISSDNKNYSETLSTLRFGQRVKCIQNKPVINEITEEDVNDLTDQIRQLKEELIKTKLNVGNKDGTSNGQSKGRSVRESVNRLRISLNRSLMRSNIHNDSEEVDTDEEDVTELCKQLDKLRSSCEDNQKDYSCDSDSMNFASAGGSSDTYFTSEHETNCLHETEEVNSNGSLVKADTDCRRLSVLEEPPMSESPRIRNIQRKSMPGSCIVMGDQKKHVLESSKLSPASVSRSEHMQSSLRSSRIFSGPTESLAASLKRGLEIIDYHQQNSATNKSTVAFSFEHMTLKPSPAVDKANASVQTPSEGRPSLDGMPSSFICATCQRKGYDVSSEVDDSLKTWMAPANKESAAEDNVHADTRKKELENLCNEQAAKIEELNRLVEQMKHEKQLSLIPEEESPDFEDKEPEVIKETCQIEENKKHENASFEMKEKEELLMEIQSLRSKLQSYTDAAPNKSIDNLRSSLLSRSMQIRKSMSLQYNNAEELEKERQRWTEMESEWINLTDELRIDIESNRKRAQNVEMELQEEKKCTEELDDALHRAILGHARIVEHYVDLQEKYNELNENHQRIKETLADVNKAAAKAAKKGTGSRFAKAFAAQLSATRTAEKRERMCLRRENKSLRMQLRETAEAVHTAGELLVRLREAEEAAKLAEASLSDLQQENEKLRKKMEKEKNKHKMEMITMKQYMAESKLPQSALRPVSYDEPISAPTGTTFAEPGDDEAWRAEFGAIYQDHY